MAVRIAIDAMGGDHAPATAVSGALEAASIVGNQVHILLVGQEDRIQAELGDADLASLPIDIVHAPEVIGMDEAPAAALKQKTQSSIHVGLGLHKAGKVDAFLSAGNTGAVMAASFFVLGRIPGVLRPTIFGYFPTTSSHCIVLDVGANVDCRPEHLVQFARMGAVYMERVANVDKPSIAIMNVGEEKGKGTEAIKATYPLLEDQSDLNFVGNIEGRDLLHHAADVVVCDGFVGNIMLKLGESMTTAVKEMIAEEMNAQQLSPEMQEVVAGVMQAVQKRFDYQEYGGVPLLGVNGNVLIGHGGSTSRAFRQMIVAASDMVSHDLPAAIGSAFQS